MKVMTVLGTRPEIIRLSLIIKLLDRYCDHLLVHTGQNYEERLSQVFFQEMGVREPDVYLGIKGNSFGDQIGQMLAATEKLFLEHHPDRLVILGDTNSGLSSIVAARLGIPVYHLEAGNRCFDDRVPEEVNRRIIDHCSTVLMPYTNRSKENLLREGIDSQAVYVIGNPIKQVIDHFADEIEKSKIMQELGLREKEFFLVTMHRAENVDNENRLRKLVQALGLLFNEFKFPVVCSLHPRTRSKMKLFDIEMNISGISFLEPLGFFDFIKLEKSAFCILTDSGTVQEEACIFKVPGITVRDVTERPETVECGSNVLAGCEAETILNLARMVTSESHNWRPPAEYLEENVAETACRIVLGYHVPSEAEREWKNTK